MSCDSSASPGYYITASPDVLVVSLVSRHHRRLETRLTNSDVRTEGSSDAVQHLQLQNITSQYKNDLLTNPGD